MPKPRKSHPRSVALGALLRQRREALGISKRRLAKAAGLPDSTVLRLEQGLFTAPRPDKLARFAQLLGLRLADLYAKAGYIVPDELPSFASYLPVRYPKLPQEAVAELERHFDGLLERFGLSADDLPALLEDTGNESLAEIS